MLLNSFQLQISTIFFNIPNVIFSGQHPRLLYIFRGKRSVNDNETDQQTDNRLSEKGNNTKQETTTSRTLPPNDNDEVNIESYIQSPKVKFQNMANILKNQDVDLKDLGSKAYDLSDDEIEMDDSDERAQEEEDTIEEEEENEKETMSNHGQQEMIGIIGKSLKPAETSKHSNGLSTSVKDNVSEEVSLGNSGKVDFFY